jgi:hypothetical protein
VLRFIEEEPMSEKSIPEKETAGREDGEHRRQEGGQRAPYDPITPVRERPDTEETRQDR